MPDDLVRAVADEVLTLCGHGERARAAASPLGHTGQCDAATVVGGPSPWPQESGSTLVVTG
ncbi:MAG: hypothetical protein NVS3B26_20990 [Mycobacteriales bacterium]